MGPTDADRRPAPLVAVLAGGRGRRIGGSKHAVALGGRPLLSYPLAAAHQTGLRVAIVAKKGPEVELVGLAAELGPVGLLLEPDEPQHPLCGVLTALDAAGPAGVVAVGCDMPFLTGPLLARLARLRATAVPLLAGMLQPFPGRYLQDDRAVLERTLRTGGSMREALGALAAQRIAEDELVAFGDPRRLCFSVNSPEDLATAARWLRDGGSRAPLP